MANHGMNGTLTIEDTTVSYISFGKGDKYLIMIPGVAEGLKSVKGFGLVYYELYKKFAKDYQVYVFSRKDELPKGYTTKDMASDIVKNMNTLDIKKADVIGISQGGMIAQYLAINNPERVNKLVLVVTIPRTNKIIENSVNNWIDMAEHKDFKGIMIDTAEKSYVGKYLKKMRKMYGLLSLYEKKATYERFIIEAKACLSHNSYSKLDQIKCPTFIVGAEQDKVLGIEGSKELHKSIKNSELYIYEEYSHGVYEEAKDFNDRVLNYLKK